jgi:hypothetical protein
MEKAAYSKAQLEAYDKWKIAAMTERSALKDAKNEGKTEEKEQTIINCHKAGSTIDFISPDFRLINVKKLYLSVYQQFTKIFFTKWVAQDFWIKN